MYGCFNPLPSKTECLFFSEIQTRKRLRHFMNQRNDQGEKAQMIFRPWWEINTYILWKTLWRWTRSVPCGCLCRIACSLIALQAIVWWSDTKKKKRKEKSCVNRGNAVSHKAVVSCVVVDWQMIKTPVLAMSNQKVRVHQISGGFSIVGMICVAFLGHYMIYDGYTFFSMHFDHSFMAAFENSFIIVSMQTTQHDCVEKKVMQCTWLLCTALQYTRL